MGSGFRKEWCLLTRDGPETNWNARFGSDLKGTQVIERAFLEMHNQGFCEWIYPEGWPEVMAQQIDDGNAEKPPGDERAP